MTPVASESVTPAPTSPDPDEHVEIIEIVEIEYVSEKSSDNKTGESDSDAKSPGKESTKSGDEQQEIVEEVTSKVVEIRITTTENDLTKSVRVETVGEEGATVLNVSKDDEAPLSQLSNQEVEIVYGNETVEDVDALSSDIDTGPSLMESIEKELNESYEIVKEEDSIVVEEATESES